MTCPCSYNFWYPRQRDALVSWLRAHSLSYHAPRLWVGALVRQQGTGTGRVEQKRSTQNHLSRRINRTGLGRRVFQVLSLKDGRDGGGAGRQRGWGGCLFLWGRHDGPLWGCDESHTGDRALRIKLCMPRSPRCEQMPRNSPGREWRKRASRTQQEKGRTETQEGVRFWKPGGRISGEDGADSALRLPVSINRNTHVTRKSLRVRFCARGRYGDVEQERPVSAC